MYGLMYFSLFIYCKILINYFKLHTYFKLLYILMLYKYELFTTKYKVNVQKYNNMYNLYNYNINGKNYSLLIKKNLTNNIISITNQNDDDVLDEVNRFIGPNYDMHGLKLTPKMLGYDFLTFTVCNQVISTYTVDKDDIIDIININKYGLLDDLVNIDSSIEYSLFYDLKTMPLYC